jgi:hypothetical protein
MPSVMIVSAADLAPRLGPTLLWRRDIERVTEGAGSAVSRARELRPNLVIVDADSHGEALALLRELRADPVARDRALVALRPTAAPALDSELRAAGANLVLSGEPIPFLWDRWLEELLSVPRRKAARLPVRLEVWARHGYAAPARSVGHTVNVSVRGLLLETSEPLTTGATLDLEFHLPGDDAHVEAVGQVVRQAALPGRMPAFGIKLLRTAPGVPERLGAFVDQSH